MPGGYKTNKVAVTTALQDYIRRHKQLQILELAGTVAFDVPYWSVSQGHAVLSGCL